MSAETIAHRYARAIFDLGVETSTLTTLVQDVQKLAETYETSEELRRIMMNPLVAESSWTRRCS